MGKQRPRPAPKPSPPLRLSNWAGIRPQRLKEIDALCAQAWLPPDDQTPWYAGALPDGERRHEP